MEDELSNEETSLPLESIFCPRCGGAVEKKELENELCHRCRAVLLIRKRIKQTVRIFSKTFLFVFISSLILSFQGKDSIHKEWFHQSLFFASVIGLFASLIVIALQSFRNQDEGF
jgi:reverse gyrase